MGGAERQLDTIGSANGSAAWWFDGCEKDHLQQKWPGLFAPVVCSRGLRIGTLHGVGVPVVGSRRRSQRIAFDGGPTVNDVK